MTRGNTDVSNANEFLTVSHAKVAKERRETQQDELNRNAVLVGVGDALVRIYV